MTSILAITGPIFILMAVGHVALHYNVITRTQALGMGRFVITLALPSLLFQAVLARPLADVVDPAYLLAYGLASLLTFALGGVLFHYWRGERLTSCALIGMSVSISNSGFIGYPVALAAVGSDAAIAMALCMALENLLMIPLGLFLADLGQQQEQGPWQSLRNSLNRLVRNPMLIGLSFGLLLSVLEIQPPAVVMKSIELLAAAAAPLALFVIGTSLSGLKTGGQYREMGCAAVGKLLVHPLLVMLFFTLIPPANEQLTVAGILIACAPLSSLYPLLGQRYGYEGRSAAILVGTVLGGFFSISGFIWLLA